MLVSGKRGWMAIAQLAKNGRIGTDWLFRPDERPADSARFPYAVHCTQNNNHRQEDDMFACFTRSLQLKESHAAPRACCVL